MQSLLFTFRYYCQNMPDPMKTAEDLEQYILKNRYFTQEKNAHHPLQNVHVRQLFEQTVADHNQQVGNMIFCASYLAKDELTVELNKAMKVLNRFWRGIYRLEYELLDFQIYSPHTTGFVIKFESVDLSTYYPLEMEDEIPNIYSIE